MAGATRSTSDRLCGVVAEWIEREVDEASVDALVAAGQTHLMARLLALRGVTPETVADYFNPSKMPFADPSDLPGVDEAVEAILAAVRAKRKIVVFGDYDCDGVCATAILVRTLAALGATAEPFLPERMTEGYGMTEPSVKRLLAEQPDVGLVITVDNGINSVEPVADLKARGIDVVVTDHHLPGPDLPDCPVVNPKVAAPAALEGLCGAGVAFYVAYALINRAKAEGLYTGGNVAAPLLALAGLATVTDIMPLRGQNRMLVAMALQYFHACAPIGLKELHQKAARVGSSALTARDFGFLFGPRINAAGRMGSAMRALRLVLTKDREEARALARDVDLANVERKTVEKNMMEAAEKQLVKGAAAQVIDLPDGHVGVAGIVASRILEKLASETGPVPVCIAVGDHGSARAPEGYNVRDAFDACSEFLTRYGGHAAAGGFGVKDGQIDAFREAFAAACAAQAKELPPAGKTIDAWVSPGDLTETLAEAIKTMAPFGEANPEPILALRGVRFAKVELLGREGTHAQFTFKGTALRAVWWGHGDRVEALRAASTRAHDICFTVELSDYGERHVELRLIDVRESTPASL